MERTYRPGPDNNRYYPDTLPSGGTSPAPRGTASFRAFSLMEVLVVVTIVAILAAILFPVFVSAKWKTNNAVCVSNLRQLGVQFRIYADDFDDHMPVGNDWYWGDIYHIPNASTPKVNKCFDGIVPAEMWHCPADLGFRRWTADWSHVVVDYMPSAYGKSGQSYDYNATFFWDPWRWRLSLVRVNGVQQPDRIALLKDSHHMWHPNNSPRDPFTRNPNDLGSWNVLYLDGHVVRTPNTTGLYGTDLWRFWVQENNAQP